MTCSEQDLSVLVRDLGDHYERLGAARRAVGDAIRWYPYDILGNVVHLNSLLQGSQRDLGALAKGLPVADIGGADGDLSFTLEHAFGWEMDLIDNAHTNMNGLQGARAIGRHLGSKVRISEVDLDTQFALPSQHYGLAIFLGILYHLQNPFYALRHLAIHADHCILSTKVARFAGPERTPISALPIAYLVHPTETNNDATNYWIFSLAGLERITERAGWKILRRYAVGDTEGSDPVSPERDERMFLLLASTQ